MCIIIKYFAYMKADIFRKKVKYAECDEIF